MEKETHSGSGECESVPHGEQGPRQRTFGLCPEAFFFLSFFFLLRIEAGSGLRALLSGIYPWNRSPCQERDDKAMFMQSIYDILKYIVDFYNDSVFIEFMRDCGIL